MMHEVAYLNTILMGCGLESEYIHLIQLHDRMYLDAGWVIRAHFVLGYPTQTDCF